VLAALAPLAAWAVLNGLRFDDYTLARGGNAIIPFYRAFISDKIVSPDNGLPLAGSPPRSRLTC
jgi:hypothetical protein